MVGFHVSTFILLLHIAGGSSFRTSRPKPAKAIIKRTVHSTSGQQEKTLTIPMMKLCIGSKIQTFLASETILS